MPPKRPAMFPHSEESPAKRHARDVRLLTNTQPPNARSSTDSPPKRVIRTYAKVRTIVPSCRLGSASQKENDRDGSEDADDEIETEAGAKSGMHHYAQSKVFSVTIDRPIATSARQTRSGRPLNLVPSTRKRKRTTEPHEAVGSDDIAGLEEELVEKRSLSAGSLHTPNPSPIRSTSITIHTTASSRPKARDTSAITVDDDRVTSHTVDSASPSSGTLITPPTSSNYVSTLIAEEREGTGKDSRFTTPSRTSTKKIFEGVVIPRTPGSRPSKNSPRLSSHSDPRQSDNLYSPIVFESKLSPSSNRREGQLSARNKTFPSLCLRSPSPVAVVADPRQYSAPTVSQIATRVAQGSHADFADILANGLPPELVPCMHAQRRSVLEALHNPKLSLHAFSCNEAGQDEESFHNAVAMHQLTRLLSGTVERSEGNSCLILGPKGSGKSRLVFDALEAQQSSPIVIRLNGYAQISDRLAMKEIAWQLAAQTGATTLCLPDENGEDEEEGHELLWEEVKAPPPPAHLPAFISTLHMQSRPVVVVIDAFDLFTAHARQALLYCLLDTAQSCRPGSGSKGLAVVGLSTRVDTINLLEKRVKSRFSSRIIHTFNVESLKSWTTMTRHVLMAPVLQEVSQRAENAQDSFALEDTNKPEERTAGISVAHLGAWTPLWRTAINTFLQDSQVEEYLNDTFSLSRDIRIFQRLLTSMILRLSERHPFPSAVDLLVSARMQRSPSRFPFLHALPYSCQALLVAAYHQQTAARDVFTFEMLYTAFNDQVRATKAAPVQLGGFAVGMMDCTREAMTTSFECLVSMKVFIPVAPASSTVARQFVKYRCAVERENVRTIIQKGNNFELRKWFGHAS